jgi:hypothetical protein
MSSLFLKWESSLPPLFPMKMIYSKLPKKASLPDLSPDLAEDRYVSDYLTVEVLTTADSSCTPLEGNKFNRRMIPFTRVRLGWEFEGWNLLDEFFFDSKIKCSA